MTHTINRDIVTWTLDDEDRIHWGNVRLREILGVQTVEELHDAFRRALSQATFDAYAKAMEFALLRYEAFSFEIELTTAQNESMWLAAVHVPRFDENGTWTGYIVSAMDITAQKRFNEKAWVAANYDKLTGLANRTLFEDHMNRELENMHRTELPFAVLFCDLDGFKAINDQHGDEAGDEALREVARRWLRCIRRTDTLARFGGDEFALLLAGIPGVDVAKGMADKMIDALREPVLVAPDVRCQLGVSIGIATPSDDKEASIGPIVARADDAMYVAKKSGKNRYHC